MNNHSKAKLTALSRAKMIRRIIEFHQPVAEVAAGFGISERSAYKWLARFAPKARPGSTTAVRAPNVPPEPPIPSG